MTLEPGPAPAEPRLAAAAAPAAPPPAPWRCALDAVVWLAPPARGRPVAAACALVQYRDTPVGPYREILTIPGVRLDRGLPAATIPFIAVDSLASLHGGRENWALPKTLAHLHAAGADGDGWSVRVRARARKRAVPFAAIARIVQPGPVRFTVHMHGHARLGRADVRASGSGPAAGTATGEHLALVLERVHMHVAAPDTNQTNASDVP